MPTRLARIAFAAALLASSPALAFTVTVVGPADEQVGPYRYLVEEDNTLRVAPGLPSPKTLGVGIERSHATVVATGASDSAGSPVSVSLPSNRRYFVSILPYSGFSLGGAPIDVDVQVVTVHVPKEPIPTAQVSVFAFEDSAPINGVRDLPAERPLAGFGVVLSDERGPLTLDASGNPLGVLVTDSRGEALVPNLVPGRYRVQVIPPADSGWIQTSPGTDLRARSGEPRFLDARGPLHWMASFGFVREKPMSLPIPLGTSPSSIGGRVAFIHENHPPLDPGSSTGRPVPDCYVGLNDPHAGGRQVFTSRCGADSTFRIEGVPPGRYQLALWDGRLDAVLDVRTLEVPADGASLDLGEVGLYARFGRFEGSVFQDQATDGFQETFEPGVEGETVNLRFPDGSLYGSTVTDVDGRFGFPQVFPFTHFLVAEADAFGLQTTGATIVVDDGGPLAPGESNAPQPQPESETIGLPANKILGTRTEAGPRGAAHSQAMTLFPGTTSEVHWGKTALEPAQNGGISGMVRYATTRAEDDARLAVADPWEPGIPRVELNLYEDFLDNLTLAAVPDGIPDGPAIASTLTSSWDEALPSGCVYPRPEHRPEVHGAPMTDCAENARSYDQVRPGVYDGRYSFGPDLPVGTYVVEVVPPPGYLLLKEEDQNVDFGDQFVPYGQPSAPACVGEEGTVPAELSLFPGTPAPRAGQLRRLCDKKQVVVADTRATSADFFLFTEVPKAARIWGRVSNDQTVQMDAGHLGRGEHLGAAWMPVSLKDFTGRELVRVYTDEWGRFNALAPSTFTANAPTPAGVSPNMIGVFANDPGPVRNPDYDPTDPSSPELITDPFFDPRYALGFGESWELYPGKTTHVDAVVRPIAAFAGNPLPVDADLPDGTPVLAMVSGPEGGPFVRSAGDRITLTAAGPVEVPNPDYDPTVPTSRKTVVRDYGFGRKSGEVTVGGEPLTGLAWSADGHAVSATVGPKVRTGQLRVRRGDNGRSTVVGITLHVGNLTVLRASPAGSVQDLIDTAPDGALLVLSPGVYRENLILWKPVQLQGTGAGSTVLDCRGFAQDEKIRGAWQARLEALVASGDVALLPGADPDLAFERGACVTVAAAPGRFTAASHPAIDGLTLTGAADTGGGVLAYAHARFLRISNDKIAGNQGSLGGGIRIGAPFADAGNEDVLVRNCHLRQNGSLFGAGGGIAVYTGSHRYRIAENWIVGNRALTDGGGVAHLGLSRDGHIAHNVVASNESGGGGGGISLAGERVPAGSPAGTLSEGAGTVSVDANLIQGNLAGGGDGGGLLTQRFNGQDVQRARGERARWWALSITGNVIANNASAGAGGVALSDTAAAAIVHDTIACNDSTSTSREAFGASLVRSVPQPAGVVVRAHGAGLAAALKQAFSAPALVDDIVWQNRSFLWDAEADLGRGGLQFSAFRDLAVLGADGRLDPRSCLLTSTEGTDPSNLSDDPKLVRPFFNSYQAASKGSERGHLVAVTFTPNGVRGDYHLLSYSPAVGRGDARAFDTFLGLRTELGEDLDRNPRPGPAGSRPDLGADETPYAIPTAGGPLRPEPPDDDPSLPGRDDPLDGLQPIVPADAGLELGLGYVGGPPTGCGCSGAGAAPFAGWLLAMVMAMASLVAAARRRKG
ncbi:MAG TPA: hypothetical protein VGK67_01550 [Myxococcales bacterium]